ncbi:MAG: hypothetical protein AB1Z98_10660 [Nannocystaceae bacterium]
MLCRPKPLFVALALTLAACGDDTTQDPGPSGSSTGPTATNTTLGATADASTTAADTTAADSTTAGVCEPSGSAIVTDIDETLTLSDAEFIMQIGDGNYDPVEREGAAELISAYADLGYYVIYLTARSEEIVLEVTGETAREATFRWLQEHDFPTDGATTELVLAPEFVFDDTARAYKAQALMDRQVQGLQFDYAYGNATSDIGAYADAGIALDATFIIGEHAGEDGTVAVAGEGWVEHTDMHLPDVPEVCPGGIGAD